MKEGENIDYYLSGDILSKCFILEGSLHGLYIHYYESGDICSTHYHINGKLVTKFEWISYTRNIKLELLGL